MPVVNTTNATITSMSETPRCLREARNLKRLVAMGRSKCISVGKDVGPAARDAGELDVLGTVVDLGQDFRARDDVGAAVDLAGTFHHHRSLDEVVAAAGRPVGDAR